MDRPAPDPAKLLEAWMEWERGEATPGRVMSTLKTGGLRDLLEEWASSRPPGTGAGATGAAAGERSDSPPPSTEAWTPVV